MEKFKKKLVEMCKVNVKAAVVFIILALFLALLGIGDSEGDVYLLAAGIFAFVAILMFGTAGTKKKRIKAQLSKMEEEGVCKSFTMIFPIREQNFPKNIRWHTDVGIFWILQRLRRAFAS